MLARLTRALSPAALLTSVLALVVAGAGIGYTAAQVGTSDLQNNAVTSPKIKNGTVSGADLSKQEKFHYVGKPGGVPFANGGDGDCAWTPYSAYDPSLEGPGYRIDRDGIVHLTGSAQGDGGAGGDMTCGSSGGDSDDAYAFKLPAKYAPAKSIILGSGSSIIAIVGTHALLGVPARTVYLSDPSSSPLNLTGITYVAAGSPLAARTAQSKSSSPHGKLLLRQILSGSGR